MKEVVLEPLHEELRPVIIDVRQPDEYDGELGHLPDSILIPLDQLPKVPFRIDAAELMRVAEHHLPHIAYYQYSPLLPEIH